MEQHHSCPVLVLHPTLHQGAFAAVFSQETTGAAGGCPCYSFPLSVTSPDQSQGESLPGRKVLGLPGHGRSWQKPTGKGPQCYSKAGLAYGPSVAYGFNTGEIRQCNDTDKNTLVCIPRDYISLLEMYGPCV